MTLTGLFQDSPVCAQTTLQATAFRTDIETATEHLDASTRTRLAIILDQIEERERDASEAEDRAYAAEEKVEDLEDSLKQAEAVIAKAGAFAQQVEGEDWDQMQRILDSRGCHETDTGKLTAEVERLKSEATDTVANRFRYKLSTIDISYLPEQSRYQVCKLAAEHRKYPDPGSYIVFDPTSKGIRIVNLQDLVRDPELLDRVQQGSLRVVRGYKN